jgi:hypothetical protein
MRNVRITLFALVTACSTSVVWGQYGLYGSPETLPSPYLQASPAPAMPSSYPTTVVPNAAMPSTSATGYYYAPQPQPSYVPQAQPRYMPQPQANYVGQPQYSYPAQPQRAPMYQPYQPGAQYRYPAPAMRAPMRTAALAPVAPNQPIPAPAPLPAVGGTSPAPMEPAPQSSGMMNQMLAEQDGYGCEYGGDSSGAYRGAVGRFQQSACGPQAEGCGYDGYCGAGGYCPWYASMSVLVLGRGDARRFWTSYVDGHEEAQLSNSQFGMPWKAGGEARFGRRFCCGATPYALEAVFWSTEAFSGSQTTSLYPSGYVSTPLNADNIIFDIGGVPYTANSFFDGARSHTLTRRDEFYNVEVNLIREQLAWACDSPWDIGWSVGVRYFRFEESLAFATLSHDGAGQAYFKDTVANNLVGVQFGFDAAYNVANCLRLFITPKVGIYDNFLNGRFEARARQGSGAYSDGSVDVPGYPGFPVNGSENGIAFLTQIDVGLDYQFTCNWSARLGYRVVAVTGTGLADDQYPQYLCDTPEMGSVQHYSSLVLHGAFCGLTYNF